MSNTENFWTKERFLEFCGHWNDSKNPQIKISEHDLNEYEKSKTQPSYPEGIKSFKNYTGGIYYFHTGCDIDYQQWVKNGIENGNKIWSVQNGNEVIAVGDTVHFEGHAKNSWKIGEFFIRNDGRLMARSESHANVEYVNINLVKAEEKTFAVSEIKEKISTIFRGFYTDDLFFKVMEAFKE